MPLSSSHTNKLDQARDLASDMLPGLDKVFQFAPDPLTALAGLQMDESQDD